MMWAVDGNIVTVRYGLTDFELEIDSSSVYNCIRESVMQL